MYNINICTSGLATMLTCLAMSTISGVVAPTIICARVLWYEHIIFKLRSLVSLLCEISVWSIVCLSDCWLSYCNIYIVNMEIQGHAIMP